MEAVSCSLHIAGQARTGLIFYWQPEQHCSWGFASTLLEPGAVPDADLPACPCGSPVKGGTAHSHCSWVGSHESAYLVDEGGAVEPSSLKSC